MAKTIAETHHTWEMDYVTSLLCTPGIKYIDLKVLEWKDMREPMLLLIYEDQRVTSPAKQLEKVGDRLPSWLRDASTLKEFLSGLARHASEQPPAG